MTVTPVYKIIDTGVKILTPVSKIIDTGVKILTPVSKIIDRSSLLNDISFIILSLMYQLLRIRLKII